MSRGYIKIAPQSDDVSEFAQQIQQALRVSHQAIAALEEPNRDNAPRYLVAPRYSDFLRAFNALQHLPSEHLLPTLVRLVQAYQKDDEWLMGLSNKDSDAFFNILPTVKQMISEATGIIFTESPETDLHECENPEHQYDPSEGIES